MKEQKNHLEEIRTAQSLLADDVEENKVRLQELYILQNTAQMNVDRVTEQKNESESVFAGVKSESQEIERQLREINENKEKIAEEK